MIPATGSTALAARTWPELDEAIGAWTATLNAEELLATLAAHGVPAGKIFTAADMLTDAQFAARDMILRKDGPMIGVVPKFSRTPGGVAATGPSLGEHTREVLPGPSFEGGAGVSTDTGDASTTKRLYSRPSDAELIAQIFDKTDLKEQSHATPQLRELGQTRAGWTIGS